MRACTPSEATSTALQVNSAGICALIGLELLERAPHGRVLVRRVLQLDDAERQPVDEEHDVRPPRAAVLPTTVNWLTASQSLRSGCVEVDDLRLRAGDRPVRPLILDGHAIDQHAVQRAVAGDEVWRLDPQQLAIGVADRRRRQARVETDQRLVKPVLQDRVMVFRIGALAALDVERDLRTVPDRIAEGFQPAERRLLGIGLGKAAAHRPALCSCDGNVELLAWRHCAGILMLGA